MCKVVLIAALTLVLRYDAKELPVVSKQGDLAKNTRFQGLQTDYQWLHGKVGATPSQSSLSDPYTGEIAKADQSLFEALFTGKMVLTPQFKGSDDGGDFLISSANVSGLEPNIRLKSVMAADRPESTLFLFTLAQGPDPSATATAFAERLIRPDSPPAPVSIEILTNSQAAGMILMIGSVSLGIRPGSLTVKGFDFDFISVRDAGSIDVMYRIGKNVAPSPFAPWMKFISQRFPPIVERLKTLVYTDLVKMALGHIGDEGQEAAVQYAIEEVLNRDTPGDQIAGDLQLKPESQRPSKDEVFRSRTVVFEVLRQKRTLYFPVVRTLVTDWVEHPVVHRPELAFTFLQARPVEEINLSDSALKLLEKQELQSETLSYLQARMSDVGQIEQCEKIPVPKHLESLKQDAIAQAKRRARS